MFYRIIKMPFLAKVYSMHHFNGCREEGEYFDTLIDSLIQWILHHDILSQKTKHFKTGSDSIRKLQLW